MVLNPNRAATHNSFYSHDIFMNKSMTRVIHTLSQKTENVHRKFPEVQAEVLKLLA